MNFWRRDKSADSPAALDETFLFQSRESMAGGHEANVVKFGEVTFGGDRITGAQLARVNAFSYGTSDALIRRNTRTRLLGHH